MIKNILITTTLLLLLISCGEDKVKEVDITKNENIGFKLPSDNTDQKDSSCDKKDYIAQTLSEKLPDGFKFEITQEKTHYNLSITGKQTTVSTAIICNNTIDEQLDKILENAHKRANPEDTNKPCPTADDVRGRIESILPDGFSLTLEEKRTFFEIAITGKDFGISTGITCSNFEDQIQEIIRRLPKKEESEDIISGKDGGDFVSTIITYKDGEKQSESTAKYDSDSDIYSSEQGILIYKPTGGSPYIYTKNSLGRWQKDDYITDSSASVIGSIDFLPNTGKVAERLLSKSDIKVEKNQICNTGKCDVYTSGRDEEVLAAINASAQSESIDTLLSDPKYAKFLQGTPLEGKSSLNEFLDDATTGVVNTTYIDTNTGWVIESITDTVDLNDNLPVKVVITFDYSKSVTLKLP